MAGTAVVIGYGLYRRELLRLFVTWLLLIGLTPKISSNSAWLDVLASGTFGNVSELTRDTRLRDGRGSDGSFRTLIGAGYGHEL